VSSKEGGMFDLGEYVQVIHNPDYGSNNYEGCMGIVVRIAWIIEDVKTYYLDGIPVAFGSDQLVLANDNEEWNYIH
jgi:hypothetical protein